MTVEQQERICRRVPVTGYMVLGEDGHYHLDPERSTFADIPSEVFADYVMDTYRRYQRQAAEGR